MDSNVTVEDLQLIADHLQMRKTLRRSGVHSIFWGLLNAGLGFTGFFLLRVDLFHILLIALGIFLIVEGLVNIIVPTPAGIVVDGVGFFIVGAWNLAFTGIRVIAGKSVGVFSLLVGVAQFGWAIRRFTSYAKYAAALRANDDPEGVKQMDRLFTRIHKTNPKDAEDLIGFQAVSFNKRQDWRGQLGNEICLFVNRTNPEFIVAHPDDVEIDVTGKALLGSTLKATFHIRDRSISGTISQESYAKYEDWKTPEAEMVEPGS